MLGKTFEIFFSSWYVYFGFGMIFGSFLNVVIYRVPNGLSIISPPSSCPKCGHTIKWYENIPVISWIFLRGRCSSCGKPISVEYPIVEFLIGLLTTGLFFLTGPVPELVIYISLSYTLFCIILIDYKTYSIPHGLNITLLIISLISIMVNLFFREFLPVRPVGSLFGAVTGFGILYIIQKTGKIIYKQEAMGMGDLFLLGTAGLILGPNLTVTAFIIGSVLAVFSHSVPAFVNLLNKKKETLFYLNLAESGSEPEQTDSDHTADITGLKLQLYHSLNKDALGTIRTELQALLDSHILSHVTYIRLFFRFAAVNDDTSAISMLKKLNSIENISKSDLKKVLKEDLIGYDSYIDNYKLIRKLSKENAFHNLSEILEDNEYFSLEDDCYDSVDKIVLKLNEITENDQKLEFLLKHNRYFQLNGYTAEQKKIIELIEHNVNLKSNRIMQKYLSETALVYFKDFFFKESSICLESLKRLSGKEKFTPESVKNIYNIALFRLVFYRQRLAFGPFLSAGIMISLLWGDKIAGFYFSFLEKLLA